MATAGWPLLGTMYLLAAALTIAATQAWVEGRWLRFAFVVGALALIVRFWWERWGSFGRT